ncbi:DUF3558 domain-containing protein [Solihabitans fulvus]|uniref:DUF3558 domain-containing protein n=1 Tax=Solihabitans fulvus TaxID=1892852 RepID=A0A5B2WP75_9PSEU|nr:DUF3558 family protein [Solihabitans fulvus]KAA2253561.1 DUF3558 domain-containing protein [Solihabitans fulvus]
MDQEISELMKSALFALFALAVLATAGCGSQLAGLSVPAASGTLTTPEPSTSAQQRPTTSTPRSSTRPKSGIGSGANVFAALNSCEMIGPDQQPFPLGTGERIHPGAHGESCVYSPPRRAAVSVQFLDSTRADEMKDHASTKGKVVPLTVGKHSALQIDNGIASCMVVFAVGEADSAKVSLEAAEDSIDELCGLAKRIAEVVEPKLPVV